MEPATTDDIQELSRLESILDISDDPEVPSKEHYGDPRRLKIEIEQQRVFVYREQGRIYGVMEFNNDVCDNNAVFLSAMVVAEDKRLRGIGRRMLDFLVQETKARGKERIITTPTYSSQGFYRAYGFHPVRFDYTV